MDSNLVDINSSYELPEENYTEHLLFFDEESLIPLTGNWKKGVYSWNYELESNPVVENGVIDLNIGFVPQKRFRFVFNTRIHGGTSLTAQVYSNRIKYIHVSQNTRKDIAEYPVNFKPGNNQLRTIFYDELIIFQLNGREVGRIRAPEITGTGVIGGIRYDSPNNLSSRLSIFYYSFDDQKEKTGEIFNSILDSNLSTRNEKFLRSVKIGDCTMPSLLTTPGAKLAFPVKIGSGVDLRFSVATLPVFRLAGTILQVKVVFSEDNGSEPVELFNEEIKPTLFMDQKWGTCLVDLKNISGKVGTLTFSSDAKSGKISDKIVTIWGAPRLLRTPRKAATQNIILITAENLNTRALTEGIDGEANAAAIDNLLRSSELLESAYPASTWVPASLFSVFSGSLPFKNNYFTIDTPPGFTKNEEILSLASIFRKNGYDTVSFSQGVHTLPVFGLFQGFNEYYNISKFRLSSDDIYNGYTLIKRAALWADRRRNKNLFIHLHFDTLSRFDEKEIFNSSSDIKKIERRFWDEYSGNIRNLDGYIGRFIRELWKIGTLKNSIVIIAGVNGLQHPVFDEDYSKSIGKDVNLQCPIIFNVNRKFPLSGTRSQPVSLIDLYDTIIDLAGFEPMEEINDSTSLVKILEDNVNKEENFIISTELFNPLNSYPAFTLRGDRLKLLYYEQSGVDAREILYDLKNDALERRQLESAPKEALEPLQKYLSNLLAEFDMSQLSAEKNKWTAYYLELLKSYNILNSR
ncbi:MAG: sulfatase-like hydrolase/transferase [Acidobacteria bacterium]|nr:sulfatase-like hydrolase/transferase [Acidobacteriota bacterium]